MQQSSTESQLSDYIENGGEGHSAEAEFIGAVIKEIVASGKHVTNKAVILKLIEKLETTTDAVTQDIYRDALELVVGRTPDDPEF
ncbi:biofilm/acid-resistance regulator YmgB/AriR [Winslowiella iniecta]|uniref:Regulatory protein AriR n=1 Tax=Winslowiella iniecta TaxID=1560201 RepID=A0A0L7T987_9GAMM|nr:biofilm/acid-resistance regulator YmgB/AriR [Winslowiella iniecta]KOC91925.1 regulatory protein AriR [Winslowiella iniecta]KOC94952.1 regulatory protein AriR [Winslowiella iniecta]